MYPRRGCADGVLTLELETELSYPAATPCAGGDARDGEPATPASGS